MPKTEQKAPLDELADESNVVLFHIKTVFPITPIPSSVIVDKHKVSIVKRGFLRVKQVFTVNHEDISSVEADVGPFLASIVINTRFFAPKPLSLNYLSKKEAIQARRIINGLLVARANKTEIDLIDLTKTRQQLIELGKTNG